MRVLIVGCGYIGLATGAELVRQGHVVHGMRRSMMNAAELQAKGIVPLAADITRPETLAALPSTYDWVVHCVASSGGGAEEYQRVYLQGTRNLLSWLNATPPVKLVYTSSTSVYSQIDGSLADEASAAEPTTGTGEVLKETEATLLAAAHAQRFPAVILRLAGIYGAGRGYWLKQFLAGEAKLEGRGERFLNMIHREDVAGAIISALKHGRSGEIYNAVDDEPVTQLTVYQWLSSVLGKPLPPAVPEDGMARKRGVSNKRVSNHRLKTELGYRFKFPTFREGYAAELRAAGHSLKSL